MSLRLLLLQRDLLWLCSPNYATFPCRTLIVIRRHAWTHGLGNGPFLRLELLTELAPAITSSAVKLQSPLFDRPALSDDVVAGKVVILRNGFTY